MKTLFIGLALALLSGCASVEMTGPPEPTMTRSEAFKIVSDMKLAIIRRDAKIKELAAENDELEEKLEKAQDKFDKAGKCT